MLERRQTQANHGHDVLFRKVKVLLDRRRVDTYI